MIDTHNPHTYAHKSTHIYTLKATHIYMHRYLRVSSRSRKCDWRVGRCLATPLRPDTSCRDGGVGVRNCEISIKFASKTRNVRGAVGGGWVAGQGGEGDMSIVSGN